MVLHSVYRENGGSCAIADFPINFQQLIICVPKPCQNAVTLSDFSLGLISIFGRKERGQAFAWPLAINLRFFQ